MDYFKKLLDLLKTEREEDRKTYQKLIETTSVTERRASGFTWYPIAIRGTEISKADYITVEAERTTRDFLPPEAGSAKILTRESNTGFNSWRKSVEFSFSALNGRSYTTCV